MFLARRSVAPARQLLRNQQPRRFDSHSTHHHHGPVNESFGVCTLSAVIVLPDDHDTDELTILTTPQTSFYVVIGTFTSAFILYRWSKSNQDSGSTSWISTLIEKWSPSEETFEKRNAIHTVAMEKAAADRHLFLSQGPQAHYQLRQNEYVSAPPDYIFIWMTD